MDLERASDEGKYNCIVKQNKEMKSAQRSVYIQVLGMFYYQQQN